METNLLIIGKGDNIITMILDNLYSYKSTPNITIYNNLSLPILNRFDHDKFKINIVEDVNMSDYDVFTLGVYQPQHKMKIMESLSPNINKFINIIHRGEDISKMTTLGVGILINSKVSIAAHTTIGHHTVISDYCSINPGTNIAGNVTIGEGTTIGMGTNILHQVKIGKNTVIGAGSVVTKDIPDNVVAYGSPCKVIKDNP